MNEDPSPRELGPEALSEPGPEAAAAEHEQHRRPSLAAVLWLALIWILLWGDLTWANVIGGLVVGSLVAWAMPLPRVPFAGRVSVIGSFLLLARLAWDILIASIDVAVMALRLRSQPQGGVIRVPLRSRSDLYLTLTADMCSLVPGSIIVEAHRSTSTLYVHIFDLSKEGSIEAAHESVLAQEARIMYALASPTELREAGLPPRRFGVPSRRGLPPGTPSPTAEPSIGPEVTR